MNNVNTFITTYIMFLHFIQQPTGTATTHLVVTVFSSRDRYMQFDVAALAHSKLAACTHTLASYIATCLYGVRSCPNV